MPKKDKLNLFEKWGAIIGMVGGLIGIFAGGIAIYDRLSRPDLEILGIAPIAVWKRPQHNLDQTVYGISLIAKVKNTGSKACYILGANISGKIYLSFDEFWPIYRRMNLNSSVDEIKTKYNVLKPYRNISWVGWLADKQGLLRVDPDEERYVKIIFAKPILSIGVTLHSGNSLLEIGYEKTNEKPKMINHHPAIQWFMEDNSLRDEYKNKLLIFEIKLGNGSKYIDQKKISDLKIVTKAAWDEYTARKIYYDLN